MRFKPSFVPDFILIFKLMMRLFSLKKRSIHYPSKKRVVFALFVLPLLSIQILINQLFLLLDNIFFFVYLFKPVGESLFIVGVPRSGTTYMYDLLAKDEEHFTYFKLWELLFAPSIIQKYLHLGIIKLDRLIGKPLYRISLRLDKIIFGNFRDIHRMGLSLPEEDEMLLIYNYSSTYLYYMFPEAKELHSYVFFDDDLSERKKKRIMNYYYRCVQRHQFVFNRNRKKTYLSKNPSFVSKITSLTNTFEKCTIVYMLRTATKTIPATISLNHKILSGFSKVLPCEERNAETVDTVLRWYQMSLDHLENIPEQNKIIVPFSSFVSEPIIQLQRVYQTVFKKSFILNKQQQTFIKEHQNYKSKHTYNPNSGLIYRKGEIKFLEKRIEKIIETIYI